MKVKTLNVFFNDERVGSVVNPAVDNLELYGKWLPNSGEALDSLFQALETIGEATVELGERPNGGLWGTIEVFPDDVIEIKIVARP